MRFTLFSLAACHSLAFRPELSRGALSKHISSIGNVLSKITSPSDSLASLTEASSMVTAILSEQGPADDHISDDDRQLLSSVIDLVEKTIYSSMDASHQADVAALADAVQTASQCNVDIAARQAPDGDLGVLHQHVQDKQTELNRLQGIVDEKTEVNNTKWAEFDNHMQMIATPPACPGLPARTMPALDVFFENSEYSVWFAAQQASYNVVRDAFVAADSALSAAIDAYNIQKAVRDVQYCDWKNELVAACAAFDLCFQQASDYFTNTLVPRVTTDMNGRIEIKKAGDTLIHQVKFLLGDVEDQATPEIDTSRYEILFPVLPAKGLCDLSPLDADEWVPIVECEPKLLFEESFESVAANSDSPAMCPTGTCSIPAWTNPAHPSYVKLYSNGAANWRTPFGNQAIQVFGFRRCPGEQPCGLESNGNVLSEKITAGFTYTLTFNTAAKKNFGDWQVELSAVDEHGSTNFRHWTETQLAVSTGTTTSKDFSAAGSVVYQATSSSPLGKRLSIRLLDRDEGHWDEEPMFDNIKLTKLASTLQ